jgi:hypothetical protein
MLSVDLEQENSMQTLTMAQLYGVVKQVAKERPRGSRRIPDWVIALTHLWAVFNNKPTSWATQRCNWPAWTLRWIKVIPSSTTMSRRMRRDSVREFLAALLALAQRELPTERILRLDGTALAVRKHSKDRQAGFGRGTGGLAKGYRVHVVLESAVKIADWRVAPLNVSEVAMAQRMLLSLGPREAWYVAADAIFDTNPLHRIVRSRGWQLVANRRCPGTGLGHRPHDPGRERSRDLTEPPKGFGQFGRAIRARRTDIERFFAHLDNSHFGMGELPTWVRTHRRVHDWVHAKLILNALRIQNLLHLRAA